jgi:hypothetical protein
MGPDCPDCPVCPSSKPSKSLILARAPICPCDGHQLRHIISIISSSSMDIKLGPSVSTNLIIRTISEQSQSVGPSIISILEKSVSPRTTCQHCTSSHRPSILSRRRIFSELPCNLRVDHPSFLPSFKSHSALSNLVNSSSNPFPILPESSASCLGP